ncbi:MAG: hypothetical protein Q8R82_04290 [Hyphomonadaceae bacterium]|nr:hypothetical protein [Hyphomonadaceae bacterium]
MAVADIQGAPPGENRFRGAAPVAAGALGIVAAVVGVFALTGPETPAPAAATFEAPLSANPPAAAPEPGSSLPGVQFDQAPGGAVNMGMEIVVKFKDDGKVKDIIDSFWRDQASARTKFEAWKAGRPEFDSLKLDRVTYSNELVLVHTGVSAADTRLPAMREIAKKLAGAADISYAEPNMTAQPGGK